MGSPTDGKSGWHRVQLAHTKGVFPQKESAMSVGPFVASVGGAVAPRTPDSPSYATHLSNGLVIVVDRRGEPVAATRAALTLLTGTAHPSLVRAKHALAVAARALVTRDGASG